MSKNSKKSNKNLIPKSAPKRDKKGLAALLMRVFEKNEGIELTHKQICYLVDARDPAGRQQVFDALTRLAAKNAIKRINHFTFSSGGSEQVVQGRIQFTKKGAGFVICDGRDKDVFIEPVNLGKALNGDLVKVRIFKQGNQRDEGVVLEVVERDKIQFVGTIKLRNHNYFLIPDNNKSGIEIAIPEGKLNGAKEGEKVLAKITTWPNNALVPYGEVTGLLGKPGSNETEMLSILYNQGIDPIFPDAVMTEAEAIPIELDKEEIAKRRDFREILTFTIDPFDAKDFDDAISVRKLENGHWEVGVHIADVSHYVQPGTAMDTEAVRRSNSVYLVDRVIPMLPEQLSNVICSLRPNEDKFTFSAVFELDEQANVYGEWFGKTVIHSDRRFTYEEVQEMIEGAEGDFKAELLIVDGMAKTMRKERLGSGALSIESEEMRFKLNDRGLPAEVVIKTSKDAHKLIEEFMLLANKRVATYLSKPKQGRDKIPMVYRVHDQPDPAKMQVFAVFIEKFGHKIDLSDPKKIAKNLNQLFEELREENEFSLIQTMAIRSMAKAAYETENIGHYGLAFQYYTHFTSPIRRYADLVVHRILQNELEGKPHRYGNELIDICKHISRNERKASEAERESTKYFQTLFVQEHLGEVFDGTVSGIADHGLFVRMDVNHCEGMIPMALLPGDRYYFDQEKYRIVGARRGKEFNFGDKVKVRVTEVSPRKRQIDLELVVD